MPCLHLMVSHHHLLVIVHSALMTCRVWLEAHSIVHQCFRSGMKAHARGPGSGTHAAAVRDCSKLPCCPHLTLHETHPHAPPPSPTPTAPPFTLNPPPPFLLMYSSQLLTCSLCVIPLSQKGHSPHLHLTRHKLLHLLVGSQSAV